MDNPARVTRLVLWGAIYLVKVPLGYAEVQTAKADKAYEWEAGNLIYNRPTVRNEATDVQADGNTDLIGLFTSGWPGEEQNTERSGSQMSHACSPFSNDVREVGAVGGCRSLPLSDASCLQGSKLGR